MLRFEPAQLGFGVNAVEVDDEDAGSRAGGDADVVVGLFTPPALDRARIGGRVVAAGGARRFLSPRPARKNPQAAPGEC